MESIVKDIFKTLYSDLFQALVFAVMSSMLVVYWRKEGVRNSIKEWITRLKDEKIVFFQFLLLLYVYLMLSRTLFDRKMVWDGLSDVFGGWTITVGSDGTVVYEAIENVLLFVPYTGLIQLSRSGENAKVFKGIMTSIVASILLSVYIEVNQMIFSLGTLQISDLVYNTIGGAIGVCVVWCVKSMCTVVKKKH